MAVYAVIADPDHEADVERAVNEHCPDRQPVRPGVWLVRTRHRTSSEAVDALGIGSRMNALIITARYIAGWYESEVIERLDSWEEDTPP